MNKINKINKIKTKAFEICEKYLSDDKHILTDIYSVNTYFVILFGQFISKCLINESFGKRNGITNIKIINGGVFYSHTDIDLFELSLNRQEGVNVSIDLLGTTLNINFNSFKDNERMFNEIMISSFKETNLTGWFVKEFLFFTAIEESKLKGSYIVTKNDTLELKTDNLTKKGFSDIFLPENITNSLKLFGGVYNVDKKILRYLLIGNPGTGKTESTLVLANELNKSGVTIIKTNVCGVFKDKVNIAKILAPSLLIIDDIDLTLGSRDSGYSNLLSHFLDVLDGTEKLPSDVGIIATTNAAHMLDLAAQRPGRFDKLISFDSLTKDNIHNIILKSLKVNFTTYSDDEVQKLIDSDVIDLFYDLGVSGSYIYNTIKMLKLEYDTLNIKDVDVKKILTEIKDEHDRLKKIRSQSYISEEFSKKNKTMGFGTTNYVKNSEEPAIRREKY